MNYLAHLFLSDGTPESLVGNLLGDFVRGRDLDRFEDPIRRGIILHRRVDAFTDAHPLHRASRSRVSPLNRRYSGILVDVFYDHFLARDWATRAGEPLDEFAERAYQALATYEAILPERLRSALPRMREENWLCAYATLEGTRLTLARVSRRLSRPNSLSDGCDDLADLYDAFENDFNGFFVELMDFAGRSRSRVMPPRIPG